MINGSPPGWQIWKGHCTREGRTNSGRESSTTRSTELGTRCRAPQEQPPLLVVVLVLGSCIDHLLPRHDPFQQSAELCTFFMNIISLVFSCMKSQDFHKNAKRKKKVKQQPGYSGMVISPKSDCSRSAWPFFSLQHKTCKVCVCHCTAAKVRRLRNGHPGYLRAWDGS